MMLTFLDIISIIKVDTGIVVLKGVFGYRK